MDLFFTDQINGNEAVLEGDQFRHAVRVMRKSVGDLLLLTDGQGMFYDGVIADIRKHVASVTLGPGRAEKQLPYKVSIGIGFPKSGSRVEWCLEKLTEIGIHEIIPVISEHCERRQMRVERLRKVLVAGIKQSQRASLPVLREPTHLSDLLDETRASSAVKLFGYKSETSRPLMHNYRSGSDVLILIGPEGDFSGGEVSKARTERLQRIYTGFASFTD